MHKKPYILRIASHINFCFFGHGNDLLISLLKLSFQALLSIGQHGFVEAARGVVWDLRSRYPDGQFLPLAFEKPITPHLNTDAMFDALGDGYPDLSLRHQIKHGALFFASLDLQIVICPHLVSLDGAFQVAERDFFRLARLGYLEIVESEHFFARRRRRAHYRADLFSVMT